ncbi:hypothetical protein [Paraburkholderia sp. SIMBA_054]|uniref:hypothetical protein n=1 Tax=Paraburkholderia sp. SIMBA_054 TaxID=3085795 RepID=UPI00397B2982
MFVEFRFEVNPSGSRKLHLLFVLYLINHANKVSSSATSLKLGLHGDDKIVRPFEYHEADVRRISGRFSSQASIASRTC